MGDGELVIGRIPGRDADDNGVLIIGELVEGGGMNVDCLDVEDRGEIVTDVNFDDGEGEDVDETDIKVGDVGGEE